MAQVPYTFVNGTLADGDHVNANFDSLEVSVSAVVVPVGSIVPYAGLESPTGWMLCDGSARNRDTYAALFAVIGTRFGVGDGGATFNLPDLRGRVAVGVNSTALPLAANDNLAVEQRSPKHGHNYDLNTAVGGAHNHGVYGAGTHSHGGATVGANTDHAHHLGSGASAANVAGLAGGVAVVRYGFGGATAGTSNDHAHGIYADGNHAHTLVPAPDHWHDVTGTIGDGAVSGAPSYLILNYLIRI